AHASAQIPGAKADQWDARALRLQDLHRFHPRGESRSALSYRAGLAGVSTANARSGARSSIFRSARAGPRGERLPCSQLRTVSIGRPFRAANSAWVNLERARMALA